MKPVELTVVVNPYARRLHWRVAMVYPHDRHPASSIPLHPENAPAFLYWPLGSPFVLQVYTNPKRLTDDRSRVATEAATFVITHRRSYGPLDSFNHLANWQAGDRMMARGRR